MSRSRRKDQFRDTTIRMTSSADDDASTIRGMAHLAGLPRCGTQSEAVILALNFTAKHILATVQDGKSKKRP